MVIHDSFLRALADSPWPPEVQQQPGSTNLHFYFSKFNHF